MGLDDFERELAAEQAKAGLGSGSSRKRERSRSRDRRHRHPSSKHHSSRHDRSDRHHHSSRRHDKDTHRSRRDNDRDEARSSHHTHKRSKRDHGSDDEDDDSEDEDDIRSSRHKKQLKRTSSDEEDEEDEWVEKEAFEPPAGADDDLDDMLEEAVGKDLQRDSWMQAPSALDVDYIQRKKKEDDRPKSAAPESLKIHRNELNHFLRDAAAENADPERTALEKPAEHEVDYEFGDAGSAWRMTKLKAVYAAAKESGRSVDDVAFERYGDYREFDDAREEEVELERRKMYGDGYVGKIKPSGELFEERKLAEGVRRAREDHSKITRSMPPQGTEFAEASVGSDTKVLDQTALNKLRAQMMKAKLKKDPKAAELEVEYTAAMAAAANRPESDVVVLNAMDNRLLAGGQSGEYKQITNKRGQERGLVEENEDMSIEDMVRQERRTRTQNGGMVFAERIAKDGKFDNDLDYMDDNAAKLARSGPKSTVNLRATAISDFQKMNRILDTCPLCHHEDKSGSDSLPTAPIVSLATRAYMTLPTEPELTKYGATIVPIQHRTNLLECDDDEWEEMRNFMKSLTRMYASLGKDVIFYENAAAPHRKRHATLEVVPLPPAVGETASAYFREAILASDDEWSQHKKLIDTLAKAQGGLGKLAFRRTLVKDVPYFHVWFTLDGGLGHVVENSERWPKGDLFAREVIGGMLDVETYVIKKQGRWHRQDRRVESFRKKWDKFDWTKVLLEQQ